MRRHDRRLWLRHRPSQWRCALLWTRPPVPEMCVVRSLLNRPLVFMPHLCWVCCATDRGLSNTIENPYYVTSLRELMTMVLTLSLVHENWHVAVPLAGPAHTVRHTHPTAAPARRRACRTHVPRPEEARAKTEVFSRTPSLSSPSLLSGLTAEQFTKTAGTFGYGVAGTCAARPSNARPHQPPTGTGTS